MSPSKSYDELLRSQIEEAAERCYSSEAIETRIVDALCQSGEFSSQIDAGELAVILRNVVYTMFKEYRIAGLDVRPLHNIPWMNVTIQEGEARVSYVVHIHKPIIAFLSFQYSIINDGIGGYRKLKIKPQSFIYKEKTRRFDLKAKAGLAAVNIKHLALKELQDLSRVIVKTLPTQLLQHGVLGNLRDIELQLQGEALHICLRGEFSRQPEALSEKQPKAGQQVLQAQTSTA